MDANEIPEEFKMGTDCVSMRIELLPGAYTAMGNNDLNYIHLIISSLVVHPQPTQPINTLLCTI